jgi:hypothetical protein
MVRLASLPLPALAAGLLAVLLHPGGDVRFMLALCAYIAAGTLVERPLLRYLLPVAGTAGFEVYCMATFATGVNDEHEFAGFILAALAWAALLGAGRAPTPRRAALGATVAAAAAAGAFAFLAAADRFVAFYAPFSRRGAFADPLHLAQVAMCAIVFFLAVWTVVSLARRRKHDTLLAYAEAYVACGRELESLGRKYRC